MKIAFESEKAIEYSKSYLKRNFSTQKRNLEAQRALDKTQKGDCEMKTNDVNAKLVRLLTANPELPIVAMVSWDVVGGDDYSWWNGSVFDADIEKVWEGEDGRMWTWDEATDEPFEFLEHYDIEEESDAKAIERIKGLPWRKVIMVCVDNDLDDLFKKE